MYNKMIREGQISRKKSLGKCSIDHKSSWIHGERLLGILEDLGVSKEQIDVVLDTYRIKLVKP